MSNRTRVILAILAVCCIIGFSLLLIFNDPIRSFILDPIVKGINAARYTLGYMPQDLQWIITLLIVFVIVLVYYMSRIPKRARQGNVPRPLTFPSQGRAMRLTLVLEGSAHNKFRRERVIMELRDLAARSVAYRRGISIEEAKDSLDTTEWTDDPSVRAFLSLDKHRAGKQEQKGFHDQAEHVLAHIERTYQEV